MPPNIKCLLVDDLEENLLALSALLRSNEVDVLLARSGAEALELLLSNDVALAFLDVQMPEMDGFQLAELMRGSERTRNIPIIFVTAGSRDQHRLFKGYESGAVDFLYKPVEAHVLQGKAEVFFQLHRQQQMLARQLQERTETLRLNEMFTAILGHDLRSPLQAILMAAHVIKRRSADTTVQEMAASLENSGKRMSRMVDDMLDLTRARLGAGISLTLEPVDLGQLTHAVVQEQQVAFPEQSVDVQLAGELTGEWDSTRLGQVISNLIGNALQHGESKGAIEVRVDGTAADVVLTVTNEGSIPQEMLPHLFDPFRGQQRQRGRNPGLGLGLYIAQKIVESHQGTIEAESQDATHTCFRVRLPRRARNTESSTRPG